MTTDPVVYSNAVSYLDPANNKGFIYRPTAGQFGGKGVMVVAEGTIVPTTGDEGLPYRMVRIPTNAIVKKVEIILDAAVSTFTADVGLYFSDSTVDGTPALLQGLEASKSCFAYQLAMATFAAVPGTDPSGTVGLGGGMIEITFANSGGNSVTTGYYVPSAMHLPIWQALVFGGNGNLATPAASPSGTGGAGIATTGNMAGLLADPGGYFDVTIYNTANNSGSSPVTIRVTYVEPM